MSNNLFEIASRKAFRFETPKGLLTVEDLWNIPLTSDTGKPNLDDIARGLFNAVKDDAVVSFVNKKAAANPDDQTKFELVKHIIETRLAEDLERTQAADAKARKQRLLGILEQREHQELLNLPIDELRAQIEAL